MGNKPRPKMSPADRAKQFMPFDAVKGLREALAAKEAELLYVEKNALTEETEETLNSVLNGLRAGDTVRITYYADHGYRTVTDTVRKIIPNRNLLQLSQAEISFADISEICKAE